MRYLVGLMLLCSTAFSQPWSNLFYGNRDINFNILDQDSLRIWQTSRAGHGLWWKDDVSKDVFFLRTDTVGMKLHRLTRSSGLWSTMFDAGSVQSSVTNLKIYNVLDYGAVGNGVADDSAAIYSAIAAAPVGSAVFFPAGTYLTGEINAKSGVYFLSYGATLKAKQNMGASTSVLMFDTVSNSGC